MVESEGENAAIISIFPLLQAGRRLWFYWFPGGANSRTGYTHTDTAYSSSGTSNIRNYGLMDGHGTMEGRMKGGME